MKIALQHIIRELQRIPSAQLTGAVKTYPLRELRNISNLLQIELLRKDLSPHQAQQFRLVKKRVQEIVTKRTEVVQQLVAKFAEMTPEVIALNNSVFALVPSRDLLEDMRTAFENSPQQLQDLTRASTNILEAVNIEIQQQFYKLSPEAIAIHYSGQLLESYHNLLKSLLVHIQVNSDIFKVYKTIIRKLVEGAKISKSLISVAKGLCDQVFQTVPPSYDTVLNQYTTEELESSERTLRASLAILERDITRRPSIVEFTDQCRHLLQATTEHATDRKPRMRKTTRVLQLSHYVEFLSAEKIAENATSSLMLCQTLLEDTQRFLRTQQTHLDVTLNIKSLEEAQQKIEDGLRYRQYALGQLFKEISSLAAEELSRIPEKRLGDSTLLLQEIQNLIEDFIRRSLTSPPKLIVNMAESFRAIMQKLHAALLVSRSVPGDAIYQPLEFEQNLPNLSKFYDEELVGLIRKALKPGSSVAETEANSALENAFVIPIDRLQTYIEAFMQLVNTKKIMLGYLDFIK